MNKWKKVINEIREKSSQILMFYIMLVVEMLAMFAVAIMQIAMDFDTDSIIPLLVSVAYLGLIMFLFNMNQEKLEFFKALALLPMLLFIIPYLFLGTEGGGIKSGMPIWMVLGLLMIFLFTKGVYFILFFSVTLSVYIGCMVYTYLFLQDKLGQLEEIYYYEDNIMGIVAVSVSCGMIIKYHQKLEDMSKKKIEQEKLNAQNANEAKTRFLTSMSHDIRTPMNAIIGMTEMADYYIDDKEKVQECLKKINTSSMILLHLIDNVLDMSEIESRELKLKEACFSLKEGVEKVCTVLEQSAVAKKLSFEVHFEEIRNNRLIGDVVRLKQVLMNLVNNSLKYTPPGGNVSLLIRQEESQEEEYAYFLMEVKDTGIGMTKEYMDTMLFKPFSRDDTQYVNKTEGYGIGMSITKNILDVMGADLQIDSEVGKGTTFRIHLKIKIDKEEVHTDTHEKNQIPNLADKKILVVEDNEINMEIMMSILERTKAKVTQAWNAEDAIEIFEKSEDGFFDLLLFDIQLPGMNGYEAVKIIREMDRKDANSVFIWAMTANAFSQDVEKSRASGMNDHISKPIDIDLLYKKMQNYLCE